jgi:hypothetical protein
MDKKDISEQVVKKYLKEIEPFEPYPDPAKYRMLGIKHTNPRWYKYELENAIQRKHQYSIVPFKKASPSEVKTAEFIKNLPFQ